jgi:hypothetical protein
MHGRLGAGAGEANTLETRHRVAQKLCERGLQFIFVGTENSSIQNRVHSLSHASVAVSEKRGTVAAAQVDVLLAIEVPNSTAGATVK